MKYAITFLFILLLSGQVAWGISYIKNDAANVRLLNKLTGKYEYVEIKKNSLYIFDDYLHIILRQCYKSSIQDEPESVGFIQVSRKLQEEDIPNLLNVVDNIAIPRDLIGVQSPNYKDIMIFSGWLFASSSSVSYLEDQVYDVVLASCGISD